MFPKVLFTWPNGSDIMAHVYQGIASHKGLGRVGYGSHPYHKCAELQVPCAAFPLEGKSWEGRRIIDGVFMARSTKRVDTSGGSIDWR
jgi:hypothetical protein